MNSNLKKLAAIAGKPSRWIVGLMSGTSLDGLDIALCEIAGSGLSTKVRILYFKTVPYPGSIKGEIRKVFAKDMIDFRHLCLLNPWLGDLHGGMITDCLGEWGVQPGQVDLIASHGQTVYHAPKILHRLKGFPNATLQIGDGDHIACRTGILTLSDFRQKHTAAGGEGAPLALYGDYLVFSAHGEDRLMLNMGGIANFTFLPGSLDPRSVFVTDTGPGNTLIDAFAQYYFQADYDRDALFARQGNTNVGLLNALLADEFFKAPFPRTTGPELFNREYVRRAQEASHTLSISSFDMMATLTQFSADSIVRAIRTSTRTSTGASKDYTLYLSGGGAHNPLLRERIGGQLPGINMRLTDALGIPADAKEAVLFAILANETLCGEPVHFGNPGMPAVTMGKISFPD